MVSADLLHLGAIAGISTLIWKRRCSVETARLNGSFSVESSGHMGCCYLPLCWDWKKGNGRKERQIWGHVQQGHVETAHHVDSVFGKVRVGQALRRHAVASQQLIPG